MSDKLITEQIDYKYYLVGVRILVLPYCPAVPPPPPFCDLLPGKRGGEGRNNEDLRFRLAVKPLPPPPPSHEFTYWDNEALLCGRRRELFRSTCCGNTEELLATYSIGHKKVPVPSQFYDRWMIAERSRDGMRKIRLRSYHSFRIRARRYNFPYTLSPEAWEGLEIDHWQKERSKLVSKEHHIALEVAFCRIHTYVLTNFTYTLSPARSKRCCFVSRDGLLAERTV